MNPLCESESVAPESTALEVWVAARTDLGRKRTGNEDNYLVLDLHQQQIFRDSGEGKFPQQWPGLLLAVADGMGGHQSGEVASQLCLEILQRELSDAFARDEFPPVDWRVALSDAVQASNRAVYEQAEEIAEQRGMGTTLTAALLHGRNLLIAQVGDSRAYLLRDETLTPLTTDQTIGNYVQSIQPDAVVDKEAAEMLVQAVGSMPEVQVVLTTSELQPGDVLLLCSDGLYKVINSEGMSEVMNSTLPLTKRVEELIERTNAGGGPDNVTVILAQLRQVEAGVMPAVPESNQEAATA